MLWYSTANDPSANISPGKGRPAATSPPQISMGAWAFSFSASTSMVTMPHHPCCLWEAGCCGPEGPQLRKAISMSCISCMVERASLLGKRGRETSQERRSEFESDKRRDEFRRVEKPRAVGSHVCDIGETPRWKVIGDHKRQPANDAISGLRMRGTRPAQICGGGKRANISEGVRTSTVRERGRRNGRGAKQRSADSAAVTAGETFAQRQCRPQP
jgi:hypothetical protein